MPNAEHVALVLVSFETSHKEPILDAIQLARATKPARIIVCHDRNGPSPGPAREAVSTAGGSDIDIIVVAAKDTGYRWGCGVDEALRIVKERKIGVDRLLMMPGDIDRNQLGDEGLVNLKAGLLELLVRSRDFDLTLGDYTIPGDQIKERFDHLVSRRVLKAAWPEHADAFAALDCSKLRTEIWVLKIEGNDWIRTFGWPSDPTPHLILATLRAKGRIGVVHLQFADEDAGRTGLIPKLFQVVRFALDLGVALAAHERDAAREKNEDDNDQRKRALRLRERLKNLHKATMTALDEVEKLYDKIDA